MSDALKAYLARRRQLKLEPNVLREHVAEMTETVIPKIEADIREGLRLAAELRHTPPSKTRKDTKP